MATEQKIIGLCDTVCFREMGQEKIDPRTVTKVYVRRNKGKDWEKQIEKNKQYFWSKCPSEAEKLFRQFLKKNKIVEINFENQHYPVTSDGDWISDEAGILWRDEEQAFYDFQSKNGHEKTIREWKQSQKP